MIWGAGEAARIEINKNFSKNKVMTCKLKPWSTVSRIEKKPRKLNLSNIEITNVIEFPAL